jgi:hypothetical protein
VAGQRVTRFGAAALAPCLFVGIVGPALGASAWPSRWTRSCGAIFASGPRLTAAAPVLGFQIAEADRSPVDFPIHHRTNMVFQNTQVTRGTAAVVVTATGSATEMGRIADMVTSTQRQRSPLQKEGLLQEPWVVSASGE